MCFCVVMITVEEADLGSGKHIPVENTSYSLLAFGFLHSRHVLKGMKDFPSHGGGAIYSPLDEELRVTLAFTW